MNDPHCRQTLKDAPKSAANSEYTVVVADDDADLNHVLRDLLREAGFSVLTSGTGVKALDMIRYARRVDVVLLDYKMPILDGGETIGFLRKYFPGVKAIGVTGVDSSELPETYREGVDKLLAKPIKGADLIEAIYAVIGVPAVVQEEIVKRSRARVSFWLLYLLFVVASTGILVLLYQATADLLASH